MPTQKKPKQKAKQKSTQKQVCFNADALTHYAKTPHANETRKKCLDFTPPTRFVPKPNPSKYVMSTTGEE
eukprot:2263663-Amphidinium_carterae.1